MKIKNVIFDLDGTLSDSFDGVSKSVMYAFEKMGFGTIPQRSSLKVFLGPPMESSFKMFYGMSNEDAEKATGFFRQRYKEIGVYENALFDGVKEMLEYLKSSGRKVFIATSKPRAMAEIVLKHFNIQKYIDYMQAVEFDNADMDKTILIQTIVNKFSLNIDESVMVGDRYFDIDAANNLDMTSIGILHGAGSVEEFNEHNAKIIVKDTHELLKLFIEDEGK